MGSEEGSPAGSSRLDLQASHGANLLRDLKSLASKALILSSAPYTYFMRRGYLTVDLPNPHKQDIGVGLLKKILKRAKITSDEWLSSI